VACSSFPLMKVERPTSPILRTVILATIAVSVVIYGLMPQLHNFRVRLHTNARTRRARQKEY
jgi:hypothetical protein